MAELMVMRCGHAPNAKNEAGAPVCVICVGIDPGASQVAGAVDVTGRVARCAECGLLTESRPGLAFFAYRPDKDCDLYYCGCHGWD